MFFDDRLATVLRQRADSDVSKRTQFRQLLDILGAERLPQRSSRDPSLVASAWLRLSALADAIPAQDRARMIREPGWRFRNPELASHLADYEPDVASAALNRAQLSSDDWTALIPRLPVRARGFLRLRRDLPIDAEALLERLGVQDRGLPPPTATTFDEPLDLNDFVTAETFSPPEDAILSGSNLEDESTPIDDPEAETAFDPQSEGRSEISALVERIAQFKRIRETTPELDSSEPRLPLGEEQPRRSRSIRAFGFAADAGGRIEWAEATVAPMVIGTRLVEPPRLGGSFRNNLLERAFTRRQPIEGIQTELSGADAIAGEWIVNAQPRFTDDGNFTGYMGRFRRPIDADPAFPTPAQREADRIRQLLHELRTPVTAVQGYAEVIQQQLFGTAPHEYRALAAAIAADAARILSGFEELDRLARLETSAIELEPGETDLTELCRQTSNQLAQVLATRLAGLDFSGGDWTPQIIAIDTETAEALIWRLLATLGGACAAGEMLNGSVVGDGDFAKLEVELPAQLLTEDDIFQAEARPQSTAINAGLFGAGFALRLARAEARSAGGDLIRDDEALILTLPLLSAKNADDQATQDL